MYVVGGALLYLQLSVDDGRSSASSPEGGSVRITSITLGAEMPNDSSSRFSGCLAAMVINSDSIHLGSVLAGSVQHYRVSTHMATGGCEGGNPCSDVQCPDNTQCEAGWRNYSCVCNSQDHRVVDNQCVNPCSSQPCRNGGTCVVPPFGSAGFQCNCAQGYQPPICDTVARSGCGPGFYNPPSCTERCLCAPEGTDPAQVCDGNSGDCICKVTNFEVR